MEISYERERGRAAARLAFCATQLRNADDALVAIGREFGDRFDWMPDDDICLRAERAAGAVAEAYREMRDAEAKFFALGGPATSDGDGFRRVDPDTPPRFSGGSGPEERL